MIHSIATTLSRFGLILAGLTVMVAMSIPVCAQTEAPFKAIPVAGDASLSLSADFRLLYNTYDNAQLVPGNDYAQSQLRGVVGAELRWNPRFRVLGEIGTGQVGGRRSSAGANLQNDASLQQLFVDISGQVGSAKVEAVLGRQEFAEGPRQLLSSGDGSNLRRSWNGARFSASGKKWRVGMFDLRITQLGRGSFDEKINRAERLQGVNGRIVFTADVTLEPFWFHTENPSFRSGSRTGHDQRDTYGVRLRGKQGDLTFDWTLARQTGQFMDRDAQAWGFFAVQSLPLSHEGWKPSLTAHVDIASGGGTYGTGRLRGFNHLYSSSGYLGEARFLSLSNLLLIAPGIAVTPSAKIKLSIEYGFARRLVDNDAVYGGGMRAYVGTQNVRGHEIGGLLRLGGTYSVTRQLTFLFSFEHFSAGDILKRAQLPSGSYSSIGVSYRH